PPIYTIRQVYRALLHKAERNGYPRKQDETPYEFGERLSQHLTFTEPQLSAITEAYTLARYGNNMPSENEVTRIHTLWVELEQKWRGK
ncbi:MAG: DUF4129 domain-containing protein, partial [Chloroflexota bacterium]|nr:DUF4129 domain-containing protein [Chloroflexota bacterium]